MELPSSNEFLYFRVLPVPKGLLPIRNHREKISAYHYGQASRILLANYGLFHIRLVDAQGAPKKAQNGPYFGRRVKVNANLSLSQTYLNLSFYQFHP